LTLSTSIVSDIESIFKASKTDKKEGKTDLVQVSKVIKTSSRFITNFQPKLHGQSTVGLICKISNYYFIEGLRTPVYRYKTRVNSKTITVTTNNIYWVI